VPATSQLSWVVAWALVAWPGGAGAEGQAPSAADAALAANRAFAHIPGASWRVVEQRFWPHHTVIKLQATSDERWFHRPTLAVEPGGAIHLLTDGFVRLPAASPLSAFGAISAAEGTRLSEAVVPDYAAFFLAAHLLSSDSQCLRTTRPEGWTLDPTTRAWAPDEARAPSPAPVCPAGAGFRLAPHRDGRQVDTFLVHRQGRWARPYRFVLRDSGEIRGELDAGSRPAEASSPPAVEVLSRLTPEVFPRLALEDCELCGRPTLTLMCYVEVRRPELRLAAHTGSFPCVLFVRDAQGAIAESAITLGASVDGMTEASSIGGGCPVTAAVGSRPGSYSAWLACGRRESAPITFRLDASGALERPGTPDAARRRRPTG
jgi:hypothetical protein